MTERPLDSVRYAVVYNPVAGSGRSAGVAASVGEMLEERGHSVKVQSRALGLIGTLKGSTN